MESPISATKRFRMVEVVVTKGASIVGAIPTETKTNRRQERTKWWS